MTQTLLAVETATEACSAALWVGQDACESFQIAPNRHSSLLVSMIDELCARAELDIHRVDAIAFGEGPGSFTGLRIGVGVAQGIAFSADIPMIPVSSLRALAERCAGSHVLAAIDARQGEVYWSTCVSGDAGARPAAVSKPGAVILDDDRSWLAVGSGCDRYQREIQSANPRGRIRFIRNSHPHALDVGRIGNRLLAAGETVSPERARPLYVRDVVATRPGRKFKV